MTKVLVVRAHPFDATKSRSMRLTDFFLTHYQELHPSDQIETLNLFQEEIPEIDVDVLEAWSALAQGSDFTDLSNQQQHLVQRFAELLDQFLVADKIIIANPMWNLSFPPVLKAYIDTLLIKNKTFRYTETGPVGLLTGKKLLHIQSNGGVYQGEDPSSQYLRLIFGFIGIQDISEVFIEGIDHAPEQEEVITNQSHEAILAVLKTF